jgi:tetratricopeptide (TPR) repeat protein
MNTAATEAAQRLERLRQYLDEDPANPMLLADAFEMALACGRFDMAQVHLAAATQAGLDRGEWDLRRAHLCIATGDLANAIALLDRLRSELGNHPVLVHDLAHVHLLQGNYQATCELLAPWMQGSADAQALAVEVRAALQVLWLRALHRQHRLQDAWAWVDDARAHATLLPPAAGVAALVAVDRSDFTAAQALSDDALHSDPGQMEALVAGASVALARRDSARAVALLEQALALNSGDGRTHGLIGMAYLLARDLTRARRHLKEAVAKVPEHIGTWHALGWTRLLAGERAGALQAFEQALARDRNFAESHGAVGMLMVLEGRSPEALRHLELAERLDASNMTGRYARALMAGEVDAQRLPALARRLLDRPGFFRGKLSDALPPAQCTPPE